MNPPLEIHQDDLELIFPDPVVPMLPHATPGISWEQWMRECAERTNAYLKNYDRANDPTARTHDRRFHLE